jgi:hypothetical protein
MISKFLIHTTTKFCLYIFWLSTYDYHCACLQKNVAKEKKFKHLSHIKLKVENLHLTC